MKVTERIHALKLPFKIPVSPEKTIERTVYAFLYFGKTITLIDSGVSGAEDSIVRCIRKNRREPEEISTLILSHSHPDHIGGAKKIKKKTGCRILAHSAERSWIEDTEKQAEERPVPGFSMLVDGPVQVDGMLDDGDSFDLGNGAECKVYHTPGHSAGSLSLVFPNDKVLFTGDALPLPNDLPIYDDIAICMQSIRKLSKLAADAEVLLSSWEAPVLGQKNIQQRVNAGVNYLEHIHGKVLQASSKNQDHVMELCREVVNSLDLPPFAANPLVAKALTSSLAAADKNLFQM